MNLPHNSSLNDGQLFDARIPGQRARRIKRRWPHSAEMWNPWSRCFNIQEIASTETVSQVHEKTHCVSSINSDRSVTASAHLRHPAAAECDSLAVSMPWPLCATFWCTVCESLNGGEFIPIDTDLLEVRIPTMSGRDICHSRIPPTTPASLTTLKWRNLVREISPTMVRSITPGDLAGMWASENSGDTMFEPFQRRETVTISGPRICASEASVKAVCAEKNCIEQGHSVGVPMGER